MNDLNKIINKVFAEDLQIASVPYITESIGYKMFNKVFDLYKFQLVKTEEDKLEVFVSKFPEEIYSSKQKVDSKNVIKINSSETIENIIKNEHPWSHSIMIPTDIDTIILGNDFHLNCSSCSSYTYNLYIQCESKETAERLSKYIVGFEETKEKGFNYIFGYDFVQKNKDNVELFINGKKNILVNEYLLEEGENIFTLIIIKYRIKYKTDYALKMIVYL